MNWDRVDAARRRGKALLAVAGFAIAVTLLLWIVAPASPRFGPEPPFWSTFGPLAIGIAGVLFELASRILPDGLHLSRFATPTVFTAIGIGGVIFGLAWMWRIYKEPTKHEGAHWRFRDHD